MNSESVLNMNVVEFGGSQFSQQVRIGRLLSGSKEVFGSNYSNTHYLLEHLQQDYMFIDQITLSSLLLNQAGGFPLGQAYIFTFNNLADLSSILQIRDSHIL